jgi:hypothetical protein
MIESMPRGAVVDTLERRKSWTHGEDGGGAPSGAPITQKASPTLLRGYFR